MRSQIMVVAILLMMAPMSSGAVELGDAKRGLAYAEKVCGECHAVRADDKDSPNPSAPSFGAVADTPGMTERALAVWLQTSHPTMPDLVIPPEDMDNVIAYILSLRASK